MSLGRWTALAATLSEGSCETDEARGPTDSTDALGAAPRSVGTVGGVFEGLGTTKSRTVPPRDGIPCGRWFARAAQMRPGEPYSEGSGATPEKADAGIDGRSRVVPETVGVVGARWGEEDGTRLHAGSPGDSTVGRRDRWIARAAGHEVLGGLSSDEADDRATEEVEGAECSAPWVWFAGDCGPFRVVGDAPPTAEYPDLVAEVLVCIRDLNLAWPEDDGASLRAAERLQGVLDTLRKLSVEVWLAS